MQQNVGGWLETRLRSMDYSAADVARLLEGRGLPADENVVRHWMKGDQNPRRHELVALLDLLGVLDVGLRESLLGCIDGGGQ